MKLNVVLSVLVWIHIISVECSVKPVPPYQSMLSMALAHLINDTFGQVSSPVFILSISTDERQDKEQNMLLNDILRRTNAQIAYQMDDLFNLDTLYPRTNNLFLIDSYGAFHKIIETMNATTYNYNGLYYIVLAKNTPDALDILLGIFNECWKNYLVNINVLVESFDGTSVNIYTYFPFFAGKCYEVSPFLYNTFDQKGLKFKTKIFPEKTKSFNKCQIKVATHEFPPFIFVKNFTNGTIDIDGIEARLIQTLSDRLNFTPIFLMPPVEAARGHIYDNGTVTGVYTMLIDGMVNFTVSGHGYNLKRASVMLASYNYFNTKMVFAVPQGPPYSSFEKLFFPFAYEVWLSLVFAFTFGVPLVFCLKLWSRKRKYFLVGENNNAAIFTMFALLLGQSGLYQPRRNFARTIWAVWTLSAFVLTSSYQGSLFGFLQKTETKNLPKTFLRMFENGYVLYAQRSNPGIQAIPPNLVEVEYIDGTLDQYFEKLRLPGFKGMMLETETQIDYYNNRFIRKRKIAIHPQNFYDYPICIYFRKNSYMAPAFNIELEKYVATGLITTWTSAFIRVRTADIKLPITPARPLTNDHLSGSYGVGSIVMIISVIVFCLELLTRKFQRLKRIFDFLSY